MLLGYPFVMYEFTDNGLEASYAYGTTLDSQKFGQCLLSLIHSNIELVMDDLACIYIHSLSNLIK